MFVKDTVCGRIQLGGPLVYRAQIPQGPILFSSNNPFLENKINLRGKLLQRRSKDQKYS